MACTSDDLATIALVIAVVALVWLHRPRNLRDNDFSGGAPQGWFRRTAKPEILELPGERTAFIEAFSCEIENARPERRPVDIDKWALLLVEGISHQKIEQRAAAARVIAARNESHIATRLPAPNKVALLTRNVPSKALKKLEKLSRPRRIGQ